MARQLTDKQRLWVEAYLETWNATEAARRACYNGSDETLASIGSENLRKPKIRAEIEERLSEAAMSANEVLARLAQQARADISEFVHRIAGSRHNFLLDLEALESHGHLVKEIRYTKDGPVLKLHNSQRALELLAKHHALLTDKIKVEDWRTEVVGLLRSGALTPEEVKNELGSDLAAELFESAGVPVGQS